jgi:hypothetical protein
MPGQAKGINGLLSMQYEQYGAYGVDPTTPDLTKIYYETEGFKGSRNLITSNVQTGNRHATKPTLGNVDVTGQMATELMVYPAMSYYAVMGSIDTTVISATGEVLGTALTTPTGVIDSFNQILTLTAATHGVLVGDMVLIAAITAPTGLIGRYCRCVASNATASPVVTSGGLTIPANSFMVRIPLGITGTFTLGAGTIKKVTTPGASYLHVMKSGGALPSLVVEKGFADIGRYFKYNGVKSSKMSLGVLPEGFQKLSFDYMGKKETTSGSSFDSTALDLGKVSLNGFQINTIEEAGVASAIVTKVDLSLDNALDGNTFTVGGQGTRGALNEGTTKVSGTLEAYFQDSALYDKAVASTETSLRVLYQNGSGVGTAGNESIEYKVPELILKQETPTLSGDKGVLISCPFEAYYDNDAAGTSLVITLKTPQLAV